MLKGDPANGRALFEKNCSSCHGTYGDKPTYPNQIVELKVIGTDPARATGMSSGLVAHYNTTWLGENSGKTLRSALKRR